RTVETAVIASVITLRGDVNARIDLTSWFAPRHNLAVRLEAQTRGTYLAFAFESRTRQTLRSLDPA
ncbi:MAG: hypothetical protein C4344_06010, partial [Acidimicrobiia bacterium]